MSKDNKPNIVRVPCTQQKNGFDCGPFVGLFAQKVIECVKDRIPLKTCYVDKGKIPHIRDNMKDQCAYKVAEHLMREEGNKKMQVEDSNFNVRAYTNRLKKIIN